MRTKICLWLLSPVFFFAPLFSVAQSEHKEVMGDPYLPNAWDNTRTSPAYQFRSSPDMKAIKTLSTIFTTQVNVNASGQNILGDAGNEPSITVNPHDGNKIAIGWRQFDNVASNFRQAGWGYTTNAGQTWTFPGKIEQGFFRTDPVLDYDSSGNFYYNSLTNNPDYFCKVFKSTNGGVTWDAGTNAQGGDKQWMAIDRTAGVGSGNIYSFWTQSFSTCLPGFFTRSTNGNASYEPCILVNGNPYWGTMAIDLNGNLYIGGAIQSNGIVVSKTLNAQITASVIAWDVPAFVDVDGFLGYGQSVNPGGLLGQVSIDIDRSTGAGQGYVYVLAAVQRFSGDPGDIMFARSTDGGTTWDLPVRVNDDAAVWNTQWFGTMSVAPNGRIDAVWLDTRDHPGTDSSALYYSYSIDYGNTWSANEKLSLSFNPHLGYPNQNKMGDYFDMISDNAGAHLAWANTLNGEQDVYYSHIVPPVATTVNALGGNNSIHVYPNPASGMVTVRSTEVFSRIDIFNMTGEKIFSVSAEGTKTEINLSQLSAGVYILKLVKADGSAVMRKVIKK
jgi:hypothetical protein